MRISEGDEVTDIAGRNIVDLPSSCNMRYVWVAVLAMRKLRRGYLHAMFIEMHKSKHLSHLYIVD